MERCKSNFARFLGLTEGDLTSSQYPAKSYTLTNASSGAYLGQEVFRRGPDSSENLKVAIQSFQAKIDFFTEEQRYLQERLSLFSNIPILYESTCQIVDFKKMATELDQIMNAANVKVKSKTMSQADFMQLSDLRNTIDRRIQDAQIQISYSLGALRSIGFSLVQIGQKLTTETVSCPEVPELAGTEVLESLSVDSLAAAAPAVQAARLTTQKDEKELKLLKADNLIELLPYAGVRYDKYTSYGKLAYGRNDADYGEIGFKLSYRFEGEDKRKEIQSAVVRLQVDSQNTERLQQDSAGLVFTLIRALRDNREKIQLSSKSIENSRRLVQVLKTFHLSEILNF